MRLFKRLLKNNIIIALFNPGFWISFATGVLLSISQYIKESFSVRHYLEVYKKVWPSMLVPHTVFTKWIGGEAFSFQYFSFFILVPLLSTLPAGNAISLECKTRYRTIVMARAGKSAYFFSKLCAAFILGGLLSVFPLLLNLYLTAMTLPSIIPNNATGFFAISSESFMAEIFYTRPYQYIFIYLLFIFVFTGLLASCAVSLGNFGIGPFLNVVYPFLVCVTLYAVLGELNISGWIPYSFLNPAQLERLQVLPIVCEMLLMIVIITYSYYIEKKMDVY